MLTIIILFTSYFDCIDLKKKLACSNFSSEDRIKSVTSRQPLGRLEYKGDNFNRFIK